jgi:hypothetical protein
MTEEKKLKHDPSLHGGPAMGTRSKTAFSQCPSDVNRKQNKA